MADDKDRSDHPLSDYTRKIRRSLIAVSSLVILLHYFPELTPRDIPAIGVKVPKVGEKNVEFVIGLLTLIALYLLISYLWNAANNYRTWNQGHRRYPIHLQINPEKFFRLYILNIKSEPFGGNGVSSFRDYYLIYGPHKGSTLDKIKFVAWVPCIYLFLFGKIVLSTYTLFYIHDIFLPSSFALFAFGLGWNNAYGIISHIGL